MRRGNHFGNIEFGLHTHIPFIAMPCAINSLARAEIKKLKTEKKHTKINECHRHESTTEILITDRCCILSSF